MHKQNFLINATFVYREKLLLLWSWFLHIRNICLALFYNLYLFIKSAMLLIPPEKAFNGISAVGTCWEKPDNILSNQALTVTYLRPERGKILQVDKLGADCCLSDKWFSCVKKTKLKFFLIMLSLTPLWHSSQGGDQSCQVWCLYVQ